MFYEAIMRRVPNAYDSQALALEVGDTIQVLEKRNTRLVLDILFCWTLISERLFL